MAVMPSEPSRLDELQKRDASLRPVLSLNHSATTIAPAVLEHRRSPPRIGGPCRELLAIRTPGRRCRARKLDTLGLRNFRSARETDRSLPDRFGAQKSRGD